MPLEALFSLVENILGTLFWLCAPRWGLDLSLLVLGLLLNLQTFYSGLGEGLLILDCLSHGSKGETAALLMTSSLGDIPGSTVLSGWSAAFGMMWKLLLTFTFFLTTLLLTKF